MLDRGHRVFAVEPNAPMRAYAGAFGRDNFRAAEIRHVVMRQAEVFQVCPGSAYWYVDQDFHGGPGLRQAARMS